jgi:hypothetical protein
MENLSGGIQYLSDLMTEFRGEMRLAVAAYYCGSMHVARQGLNSHCSCLSVGAAPSSLGADRHVILWWTLS